MAPTRINLIRSLSIRILKFAINVDQNYFAEKSPSAIVAVLVKFTEVNFHPLFP
jgi:hypothetical protein